MNNTKLINKVLRIAALYHEGQKRKGKEVPYIVHPVEVAMILQKNGIEEDLIASGLLHDTLEDTEMTEEELREHFNNRILKLVKGASENLEDRENTSWEERKKHTIDYIKTADRDIKLISCADKLSNAKSMLADYNEVWDDLWKRFNRGYEKQKWYYNNLVDSLNDLAGVTMFEEFKSIVQDLFY